MSLQLELRTVKCQGCGTLKPDLLPFTSSPRQESIFIWPALCFQYNRRLLRQKAGGACLYMPGTILVTGKLVLKLYLLRKIGSSAAKNENSGGKLLFLL